MYIYTDNLRGYITYLYLNEETFCFEQFKAVIMSITMFCAKNHDGNFVLKIYTCCVLQFIISLKIILK